MVKVKEDLTGKKFNHWTVLEQADDYVNPNTGARCSRWLCECDCEDKTRKVVNGSYLKNGESKSCGCHKRKVTSERSKKYNTYDLSGEYGIGYTSKGEEFYFDLEDYDLIKNYCWYIRDDGYVVTNVYFNTNYNRPLLFHKLLLPDEIQIDHKNHKKYDNQKENLRPCNNSNNQWNKGLYKNNTTGVTGVSWDKRRRKWRVRINVCKKEIFIGFFDDFDDAVKARKEAEERYFGEWSYDNSMGGDEINDLS